jgi:hypothetical protein
MGIESRNILNPNIGLQEVLDFPGAETHLPQARLLATSVSAGTGLADLYHLANFQSRILAGLQPEIGDDALLRPDVFGKNLRESHRRLQGSKDPHVRRFLRDELGPLLENDALLRDYVNMLVSA